MFLNFDKTDRKQYAVGHLAVLNFAIRFDFECIVLVLFEHPVPNRIGKQ